ncbi:hypothetical protein BCR43DRAFT_202731 [Syncephalastrum racemosum]|uniref:Uncharacterized protein n=1 Tax=Syncephalastrum racemosum TaxID=13706 RepID=A0A1X2HHV4_SYNRA|nr:hypothetical protein BCR43DRAFT_202731 [Syncephalastrum racemosum]
MVVFREFHLSGPIRTAAQVNSVSFLISLGSEARLYHVAIPAEVSEQRDLIVIPIAEIMDVSLLYIFYHRSQDIRAYIMQNASILNAFRIDLDQVAEDNADPWILKNQVDRVLSQVKAEERLQRQLDEKQDRMNTDIVALNRVVYLLQRAKSLGKRLFQLQTECVLDNEAWSG